VIPRITNFNLPVLSVDTSTINRLLDDGKESRAIFAALESYHFRLTGINVEEIMANRKRERREQLFQVCRRLVYQDDCDTIQPHSELLRLLINRHAQNTAAFVWQHVCMHSDDYHDGLSAWDVIRDDRIAAEQCMDAKRAKKAFKPTFAKLKKEIAAILKRSGRTAPPTFKDACELVGEQGGLIWHVGKLLYDHIVKRDISETDIKSFMSVCPPFRGAVYAFLMMWYQDALRDDNGEKFKAGYYDLFMAVYLPYCQKFITAEIYREQEKCLREIATVAQFPTIVQSYDDFCSRFLVRGFPMSA
jgi:hypothetical protein